MARTLLFTFVIIVISLITSSSGQPCPCTTINNIQQCSVTGSLSPVNISLCDTVGFNSIYINYTGNVTLSLSMITTVPIFISPVDETGSHTLQISSINTNAVRIEVRIILSANQLSLPLFTSSNNIAAPNTMLRITVNQAVPDASSFKMFNINPTVTMVFANYEVVFDSPNPNSGILNFANLISGLTSVSSITISGNNHSLAVDTSQISSFNTVNRLALKNLRLYAQILDPFPYLKEYSIQACEYNGTAQFLNFQSTNTYNLSIEMINNRPVNSILPNGYRAFEQFPFLINITLIEPGLDSTCLQALKQSSSIYRQTITLQLGSYKPSDFTDWAADRPLLKNLIINNIPNLNIFPAKFFNKIDSLRTTVLQGTFTPVKEDICVFVGINIQQRPSIPILQLNSPNKAPDNQYQCTNTYVQAVNILSTAVVECAPDKTWANCKDWAEATTQCDLVSYENSCPGYTSSNSNPFYYNGSYLYTFFQNHSWTDSNRTTSTGSAPLPQQESVNIGAIIGAVCALLVAAVILVITIYCIRRHRQTNSGKQLSVPSATAEKYKPSSFDLSHVSIATSKTSQSSRYALQKSFFPPMQPNHEIAPPLYTASSESVGSISAYRLPSAPPGPRDSVSTHATHLYEKIDE